MNTSASKIPRRSRYSDVIGSPGALTAAMLSTSSSSASPQSYSPENKLSDLEKSHIYPFNEKFSGDQHEILTLCCERLQEVVKKHERDLNELRSFSNYEKQSLEQLLEEQKEMASIEIAKAKELESKMKSLEAELQSIKSKQSSKFSNTRNMILNQLNQPIDDIKSFKDSLPRNATYDNYSKGINDENIKQQYSKASRDIALMDGYTYTA